MGAGILRCSGGSEEESRGNVDLSAAIKVPRGWGPATPAAGVLGGLTPRGWRRDTSGSLADVAASAEGSPEAAPAPLPNRHAQPPAAGTTPSAAQAAVAAAAGRFPSAAVCNRPQTQEAPPAAQRDKCRTLKYYPPPTDDLDSMTVDVIDHGSEVLIVRRDPSPLRGSPPTSVLLGTSPRTGLGTPQNKAHTPLLPRAHTRMQVTPTMDRVAVPAPGAPPQVQQVRPDTDASL